MEITMDDFTPRDYQAELMEISLKKNTIIYLPTGSGKTFIALMILKRMSGDLLEPYSEGGKLSIILVNTISLVNQHATYIMNHTNLQVGQYSGDMKLDFWPKEKWYEEYDKYQVLVMTSQILYNNVTSNYIDLNKVNLLIFDECHRGVNDHAMRQLMKAFQDIVYPPRVIGLTATLLNGNCKPSKVLEQVTTLEVTFHSKVATVDGLSTVVGYSTNPKEYFKTFKEHSLTETERRVIEILKKLLNNISSVKLDDQPCDQPTLVLEGYTHLDNTKVTLRKLSNLIKSAIAHIETMGTFGGLQTAIAYSIQIERLKKKCIISKNLCLLNYIQTSFSFVKQLLENEVLQYPQEDQAFKCSSDKILKLMEVLYEYKLQSKKDLCGIIFTQQRFTAKIIYFILDKLSKSNPKYSHIAPDYMVGFDNNPYHSTREDMYSMKKNKQVLQSFKNKDINLIIASNVLEEGVDIPRCSLVVKYDQPNDYRSYIQSKGRARHRDSFYYMIIKDNNDLFMKKYNEYKQVVGIINNCLICMNNIRQEPSMEDIEKMYQEYELPPYYAAGPGSAQVNMTTAIPLLCQYCSSLPSDIYTTYTAEWYEKNEKKIIEGHSCTSVTILLPTICPLTDPIEGKYMPNIKTAKRAAALKACSLLHELGELDDHLLPKKSEIPEEDINFLFVHYPAVKEPFAGSSKSRRLHKKPISKYLRGSVISNNYYLHIIQLEPIFSRPSDINDLTLYDFYTSALCIGILTLRPLSSLCTFPIFDILGTLNVQIKINQGEIFLDDNDIIYVRKFHHRIFKDILKIKSLSFLVLDNTNMAEVLLLVPVDKGTGKIDMETLKMKEVKEITRLSLEEKLQLQVSQESYLRKIVCPWHRETVPFIVTDVCLDKTSLSPFPDEDYSNYVEYFEETYNQQLVNANLPLLLLKSLTKRLNFLKPIGIEMKRKRDKIFEGTPIHLPSELVVKQDFPSSLWIQAKFLPTILSRVSYMLQIEELRVNIAKESGLGEENMFYQPPLTLDEYLLDYKPYIEKPKSSLIEVLPLEEDLSALSTILHTHKDSVAKLLEGEFPWKDGEEPKDIERTLDVTIMDIENFELFVCKPIDSKKVMLRNESLISSNKLPSTHDFVYKPIKLLEKSFSKEGPSILDLYRALTAAKGNDIVNLERLETLGDSFLKWIASFYVYMRFPKYDEGQYTNLKGRLVSNKNLYYLAEKKNLGGIMKFDELSPKDEWLPPAYTIPQEVFKKIEDKKLSVTVLANLTIGYEEQILGCLKSETVKEIIETSQSPGETEIDPYGTKACFLRYQYVGDKHVADVVESLLGAYLLSCGFKGGIKFLEWMGVIPISENLEEFFKKSPPNPVLNANATPQDIKSHLPQWESIESTIGYKFKNHAYLLQAFTHSSYTLNRITLSYEKLEFLGDAIIDFLITCYIYESCGTLNPGELTDLRSALVNNNTFASLVIRSGLHKHLLMMNFQLQNRIDRFDEFMKQKNYEIDDEVLTLLDEDELSLAEYVDVPKVLGDIFEALIGAIYLDCDKDFKIVWNIIYRIMWKEIDLFSKNVPINPIRKLFEKPEIEPKFGNIASTSNSKYIIPLRFLVQGKPKFVHGCGTNKAMAKKAAAKLALRSLKV